MPNVAPRGLHARHGNQWKPPANVFARDDDAWKQADFVWEAGPGVNEWNVIWARTGGSPASATATYSPGQVTINWVVSDPLVADAYRVRRPDGSLAGTVENPNTTSFVDQNPRPLDGPYSVCAMLAGQESGTCAVTNSLDLSYDGFAVSGTVLDNGSANPTTELSWSHPSPGRPDAYRIYRGDGTFIKEVSGTTTTTTTTSISPGNENNYYVKAVLSGVVSDEQSSLVTLNVSPRPPVNVNLTALSPPNAGVLRLTWDNPAGDRTGYDVERHSGSWAEHGDNVTPSDWNIGEGNSGYMRVRTVSTGVGFSDWVQVGPLSAKSRPRPDAPISVSLVATNPPLSNLRLSWNAAGTDQRQVQRYVQGSGPWTNHEGPGSGVVSPSDWSTTVPGLMRVRAYLDNSYYYGWSDWVQRGPVAPINDVTPPPNASIISYGPEASYGRMVIRFRTPDVADFNSYRVQYNTESPGNWVTGWTNLHGWQSAPRDVTRAHVWDTGSAGWIMQVRVQVRDNDGNVRTGPIYTYTLLASPWNADPHLSGTLRGGTWRNDATRSSDEIATGWTSSGHNMGFFFYNWAQDFEPMGGRTITSAVVEYYRENEGGLSGNVQPLFWVHNLTGRSGQGGLVRYGAALPESQRLGQGVSRQSPPDTGTFTLPTQFITRLVQGSYFGLCMYRGYRGSGDPDNYYALLGTAGQFATGGVVNGRIKFHHLG